MTIDQCDQSQTFELRPTLPAGTNPMVVEARRQFDAAMARQDINAAVRRCPSCGQAVGDGVTDCCEPESASDPKRSREPLKRHWRQL